MKKDKKELEKKPATTQTAAATPAKSQAASNRTTATYFPFTRYSFDSAGGGYQGL